MHNEKKTVTITSSRQNNSSSHNTLQQTHYFITIISSSTLQTTNHHCPTVDTVIDNKQNNINFPFIFSAYPTEVATIEGGGCVPPSAMTCSTSRRERHISSSSTPRSRFEKDSHEHYLYQAWVADSFEEEVLELISTFPLLNEGRRAIFLLIDSVVLK